MKKKLYLAAVFALCLIMTCTQSIPASATTMEGYALLKEDTFEGDACTIATSNMLSNPQTYLWDNISTIDGTNPKAIDGNGLLFRFENLTDDSNRWATPVRVDASKVDIRNGYYTIHMQFRDAGIRTYHIQLKTLDSDVLVGEYYFDARTLATLDTGNGKPLIGSSSKKGGITEVVLDFGSVSEVYVDITVQVDVSSPERYVVLDNVQLYGLQLEDYPQFTYRTYKTENYAQSTGIWTAGANAQILETRDENLYVQGDSKNAAVLKSKAIALEEGYYKVHFLIKPDKVNALRLGLYSEGDLLYECNYDIKSNSTGITKDPIELFIDKDRMTGYYTLSVCFQNKTSGGVHFEISLEGDGKNPEMYMKRFDILESFENEFNTEEKPVNTVVKGETAGQYAEVSRVQGSASNMYLWIIAAAVAAIAVAAVIILIVRRKGRKE